MKKLSIFLASAALVALTACEDDKTPTLNSSLQDTMDAFTINPIAYADQTINLSEEGELTLSVYQQPDYGFPGAVEYTLYAALDPANLNPTDIQNLNGVEAVKSSSTATDRVITIKQSDLATTMCNLNGIFDDATWDAAAATAAAGQKLYLICGATLPNTPESLCYSNVVSLQNVTFYKAIKTPVKIWIVGSFSDPSWNTDQGSLYIRDEVKNGANTSIFKGPYKLDENGNEVPASNIAAGALSWRFYTELGAGWGSDGALPSIGSGPNDFTSVAVTAPASGGSVSLPAVPGKGNFDMTWDGGELTFVIDMTGPSPWTLEIYAGNVDDVSGGTSEPESTNVVWINNDANWSNIYVWAWDDDGNNYTGGNWPGEKAKLSESGMYWWEVPAGSTGMPAKVIFSNGEGVQTADLEYVNGSTYTLSSLL